MRRFGQLWRTAQSPAYVQLCEPGHPFWLVRRPGWAPVIPSDS